LKTKQLERPEKIQKIKVKRFIYFLFLPFWSKNYLAVSKHFYGWSRRSFDIFVII